LEKILTEILTLAKKYNKKTVFTIGIAPRKREHDEIFFPFIRESSLFIIGNVEINKLEDAIEIVKIIDGIIDYILVDDEKKSEMLLKLSRAVMANVKHSVVLTYKDNDAWIEATDMLVCQFLKDCLNKKVLIYTINDLSTKLALKLCERGCDVSLIDNNSPSQIELIINALNYILPSQCPSKIEYLRELPRDNEYNVVIGFSIDKPIIDIVQIKQFSTDTIILDAGIGSLSEDAIKYALENNFNIFRLDMRAGLSGNIINAIETYDLKTNIYGRRKFEDFNIVAGGYFGLEGDIVVDSITAPTRVIGVADGKGHLMSSESMKSYVGRIKRVEHNLLNKIQK